MFPLLAFPKNVFGIRFGAVASVVGTSIVIDVLSVFESVGWPNAADQNGLHSAKFFSNYFGWFEGEPVNQPFVFAYGRGRPQSPVRSEL